MGLSQCAYTFCWFHVGKDINMDKLQMYRKIVSKAGEVVELRYCARQVCGEAGMLNTWNQSWWRWVEWFRYTMDLTLSSSYSKTESTIWKAPKKNWSHAEQHDAFFNQFFNHNVIFKTNTLRHRHLKLFVYKEEQKDLNNSSKFWANLFWSSLWESTLQLTYKFCLLLFRKTRRGRVVDNLLFKLSVSFQKWTIELKTKKK